MIGGKKTKSIHHVQVRQMPSALASYYTTTQPGHHFASRMYSHGVIWMFVVIFVQVLKSLFQQSFMTMRGICEQ